jgi:hypothetical protein
MQSKKSLYRRKAKCWPLTFIIYVVKNCTSIYYGHILRVQGKVTKLQYNAAESFSRDLERRKESWFFTVRCVIKHLCYRPFLALVYWVKMCFYYSYSHIYDASRATLNIITKSLIIYCFFLMNKSIVYWVFHKQYWHKKERGYRIEFLWPYTIDI